MKKTMQKMLAALLSAAMVLSVSACAQTQPAASAPEEAAVAEAPAAEEPAAAEEAAAPAEEREVETIVMPYMITMNPCEDREMVVKAINEKLEEKGYPVRVEFTFIDFPSWGQQMNLMLADGSMDLFNCCFMDSVGTLVNNGALAPIDDLLDQYGQGIRDLLGEYLVCGQVGGVTYGTPKLAAYGNAPMIIMNKRMLDECGINRDDIVDLETMTDAFRKIHEQFPDVTTLSTGPGGATYDPAGLDYLGSGKPYACIKLEEGSDDLTVFNYYATDEFKELVALTKIWADEGFFRKDAMNYQDSSFTSMHDESSFSTFAGYASEAICDSVYATAIPIPNVSAQIAEHAWITTTNVNGMTWCIPALSKHKEAAMIFLNALYTDPDIANVCNYGVEGVHYKVEDNGTAVYVDPETQTATTSGWPAGMGTFWPNMLICHPFTPDTIQSYQDQLKSNEISLSSPALGFVFDSAPVMDEVAAVNGTIDKYLNAIMLHVGDSEEMTKKMLEEMDANGLQDIIEEKQGQLNEWAGK